MSKKFNKTYLTDNYEVYTESGFKDIVSVHETLPMEVFRLKTENHSLCGADKHVVFNHNNMEVFLDELSVGDKIQTISGIEKVVEISKLKRVEPMYDVQVNSRTSSYYTNGILSHNTTVAALYLLWYAMFNSDKRILVAAHKGSGAEEIMDRIRYAYESCPDHIRCGVTTYSVKTIVFDNNSKIVAQATTENTGRGLSISLLYCLDGNTKVTIKDKETNEIKEVELEELYLELDEDKEEVVKLDKLNLVRIYFEGDYYLDIRETDSIIVNDVKTTMENVFHGDEVLIGNDYFKVKDIDYI